MQNDTVGYLIRKAEKGDMRAVWAIRNNPLNRKNFNSPEEISFDLHEKWFEKKYFGSQNNKCFVLEAEKKVIGYCRFDLEGRGYLVSIAIDPVYAGKGFGGVLLSGAPKELKAGKDVFAEIKLGNLPSLKLFQKNGFVIYKTDGENHHLILKR